MTVTGYDSYQFAHSDSKQIFYNAPPRPVKPQLSSPANNTVEISMSPVLQWCAVAGANSYQIQVSRDPEFNSSEIDVPGITILSYTPVNLLPNAIYYWRVAATNVWRTNPFSLPWAFKTQVIPYDVLIANRNITPANPIPVVKAWNSVTIQATRVFDNAIASFNAGNRIDINDGVTFDNASKVDLTYIASENNQKIVVRVKNSDYIEFGDMISLAV